MKKFLLILLLTLSALFSQVRYTAQDVLNIVLDPETGRLRVAITGVLDSLVVDKITIIKASAPVWAEGTLFFDDNTGALSFYNSESDVTLQIGEETWISVRNNSGGDIADFTPVYQTGAVAHRATIAKAKADTEITSKVIGITTHNIEDNTNGYITLMGVINGVDTDGSPFSETWVDGEEIYLSATTAGEMTNVKPTGENHVVVLGNVLDAANDGSFLLFITNGDILYYSKSKTIEDPTNSEDRTIFFTSEPITISEIRAVLIGSATPSVTWTIRHHATDRSNVGNEIVTGGTTTTSTTSGSDITSFNDATIPADSFVWIETTAKSGTVDEIHITIIYTKD